MDMDRTLYEMQAQLCKTLANPKRLEILDILKQIAKIFLYDSPDYSIVNTVITVRKIVPERHYAAALSYLAEDVGIILVDPVQRFSDNLEFPLHSAPEQFIVLVVLISLPTDEADNG